jgi:hypothetical protein
MVVLSKVNKTILSNSHKKRNKKIKIFFAICILIIFFAIIYNYSSILGLKEDVSKEISLLKSANLELETKSEILHKQQQNLLKEEYDFLIFFRNLTGKYYVKSGITSNEEFETTEFSEALEYALDFGKVVILSSGSYDLNSDVVIQGKSNIILDGQGAILNLNDYSIVVVSDGYDTNNNNQIRNFVINNGTLKFENSFRATIENMVFENCSSAIEIANTNTWSEATKIENIYWENCQTALSFKTPKNNATGSYENTALERCYINLYLDNSVGIMVEKNANVSNSQWNNMRIWMHGNETQKQTGLHLEGSMAETILNDVIFESFGNGRIYGIYLGRYATTGFSLGVGSSFLGRFDARIKNNNDIWIYGTPSIFTEKIDLTSSDNPIITRHPLTISYFEIFIETQNLTEEIEVQIKLNFIDHSDSSIILPFSDNQTYWLEKQDKYDLYPSQNVIWNIEPTLLTNVTNPETKIIFGVYGTAR